jgi:hypothetical protein
MHRRSGSLVAVLFLLAAAGVPADGPVVPSAAPPATPIQEPLPTECLAERNHGACVTCCKDKGIDGNLCSAFCKSVPPPVPEPQP